MLSKIYLGSDHAGVSLKSKIAKFLEKKGYSVEELGSFNSGKKDDYPDFAFEVSKKVLENKKSKGILICGSGTGMCIAANKIEGVRAALAYDPYSARKAREDNDINVLCLRSRNFSEKKSLDLVKIFLETKFSKLQRHKRRIKKLTKLEKSSKNYKAK